MRLPRLVYIHQNLAIIHWSGGEWLVSIYQGKHLPLQKILEIPGGKSNETEIFRNKFRNLGFTLWGYVLTFWIIGATGKSRSIQPFLLEPSSLQISFIETLYFGFGHRFVFKLVARLKGKYRSIPHLNFSKLPPRTFSRMNSAPYFRQIREKKKKNTRARNSEQCR